MSPLLATLGGIAVAAIPGVIVALIGQYAAYRADEAKYRRTILTGRRLVALELRANLTAFQDFWNAINNLDADHNTTDPQKHLEGMAYGGLLSQTPPHWSFARWETPDSETLAALSVDEVERLEQVYVDLRAFNDLFTTIVALSPEERNQINQGGSVGRFWGSYYADWRARPFAQLNQLANRILSAKGLT